MFEDTVYDYETLHVRMREQAFLNAGLRITITDRREAIRTACMMAEKGDVVLVAGKGHETYQEINGVKHHFDDHEVLRDIFNVK